MLYIKIYLMLLKRTLNTLFIKGEIINANIIKKEIALIDKPYQKYFCGSDLINSV